MSCTKCTERTSCTGNYRPNWVTAVSLYQIDVKYIHPNSKHAIPHILCNHSSYRTRGYQYHLPTTRRPLFCLSDLQKTTQRSAPSCTTQLTTRMTAPILPFLQTTHGLILWSINRHWDVSLHVRLSPESQSKQQLPTLRSTETEPPKITNPISL